MCIRDSRITGRIKDFSPRSKKVHIDIDPSSINKVIRVDVPIVGDIGHVLEDALRIWKSRGRKVNKDGLAKWWKQIAEWRAVKCLSYKGSDVYKRQGLCGDHRRRAAGGNHRGRCGVGHRDGADFAADHAALWL